MRSTVAGGAVGRRSLRDGVLRVTYPFTEHATVLVGWMRITDENGKSDLYGPGDSYFIAQGTTVLVEVNTSILQKSFLNIVEQQ